MKISRKSLIGLSAITSLLVSASAVSITNKMRKEPFSLVTKSNIDMSFHSSEIDVNKNNSLEQNIEDVLKESLVDVLKKSLDESIDELNKILIKMDSELLVACLCLIQLDDGNYTDWNSFVAKFNDNAWKENEKNKPFIEKLADLLKCSFDEVNAKKIEKLSEKIESNVQKLLSEKQEAL